MSRLDSIEWPTVSLPPGWILTRKSFTEGSDGFTFTVEAIRIHNKVTNEPMTLNEIRELRAAPDEPIIIIDPS